MTAADSHGWLDHLRLYPESAVLKTSCMFSDSAHTQSSSQHTLAAHHLHPWVVPTLLEHNRQPCCNNTQTAHRNTKPDSTQTAPAPVASAFKADASGL